MTWANPVSDLRTDLSDNVTDKLFYRKPIIGVLDGSNKKFKTLEFRRVTDFKTASAPLGVYVNGGLASITSDDTAIGEVTVGTAPANGDRVEATYYAQWFLDSELVQFLVKACNWMNLGDDYTQLPQGLRPAALDYAKAYAFEKLCLRWSQMLSETYLLDDSIQKERYGLIKTYKEAATDLKKSAETLRKQYYARSDENESPLFGNNWGAVRNVAPNE